MQPLFIFLSYIFGTAIGSFLNVVILRLPKDAKLNGRSHCPGCSKVLLAIDLIPVFSFLFLRGKCRSCGKKISWRYPLIEVVTGLLFAWAAYFIHPAGLLEFLLLVKLCFTLSILLVVFVVDLEHYLIFDSVIGLGSVVIFLLDLALDIFFRSHVGLWQWGTVSSVFAALVCPLPFFLLWYFSKGRWMGFGDVKLAVFLGLALGWPLALLGIFFGILLGGLVGLVFLALGTKTLKSKLPLGTFLSIGAVICLFYGAGLLNWYLSVIGINH